MISRVFVFIALSLFFVLSACKQESKNSPSETSENTQVVDPSTEGTTYAATLDGKQLKDLPDPDSVHTKYKTMLQEARQYYLGHLNDVKAYVDYGYKCLPLGYVENAIQVLTKGIDQFPNTADLYLYRGIAQVVGRQFPTAVNDFWKAGKAVEGQQGAKGMLEKTGDDKKIDATIHYDIYRWMGLAFQCQGDFGNAEKMFEVCGDFASNPDLYCMAYYWQYQAYMRSGREKDAASILTTINPKMYISEVTRPYLDALLYYKGALDESALVDLNSMPKSSEEARAWSLKAYAIAVKASIEKKDDKNLKVLEQIMESPFWNQAAYIAAEADHHRIKGYNYKQMESKELNSGTKRSK